MNGGIVIASAVVLAAPIPIFEGRSGGIKRSLNNYWSEIKKCMLLLNSHSPKGRV
jgi:hypothetical protein